MKNGGYSEFSEFLFSYKGVTVSIKGFVLFNGKLFIAVNRSAACKPSVS